MMIREIRRTPRMIMMTSGADAQATPAQTTPK
jgi:hypothetical protein